jgi:hypothetical protein
MRRRVEWGRSGVAFALIDELWVLPKRISDCEHTAIVLACQVHELFVVLVQLFLKQVRVTINKLLDQTLRFIIVCAASDGECEMLLLALILPGAGCLSCRTHLVFIVAHPGSFRGLGKVPRAEDQEKSRNKYSLFSLYFYHKKSSKHHSNDYMLIYIY